MNLLTEYVKNKPNSPVKVGLLGSKPSFLNTIVADPFESNQDWFNEFVKRERKENLTVKFGSDFKNNKLENEFTLPSTNLSELGKYKRNIEFIEINNTEKLEHNFHFMISFSDNKFSSEYLNWPVYEFNDTDNLEVLSMNEINSTESFSAIQLLISSPKNSSEYLNLISKSNFSRVDELILKLTKDDFYIKNLIKYIEKNIVHINKLQSLTLNDLNFKNEKILRNINNWNELTHNEFQSVLKPFYTEFEQKNITCWKLYYKLDVIDELLIKMLNKQFLNNSIENYIFMNGLIDSFNLNTKPRNEAIFKNEFNTLKNSIIDNDVPIMKKSIKSIFYKNFFGLQIPMLLVASCGYLLFDFSFYSMFGLGALGFVLGIKRISENLDKVLLDFNDTIFEKIRMEILNTNKKMVETWEVNLLNEKKFIERQNEILKKLSKN